MPWFTDDGVAAPVPGDICVARCREFGLEDICMVKVLENGQFQWHSNLNPLNNPRRPWALDAHSLNVLKAFYNTQMGDSGSFDGCSVFNCDANASAAEILALEGEKVPFVTQRENVGMD